MVLEVRGGQLNNYHFFYFKFVQTSTKMNKIGRFFHNIFLLRHYDIESFRIKNQSGNWIISKIEGHLIVSKGNVSFHMIPVPNSNLLIGETVITNELWTIVTGWEKENNCNPNLPVTLVSHEKSKAFISALNSQTGLSFRLPTIKEWDLAFRGGSKTKCYNYAGSNNPDLVAWYRDNSDNKLHPVKEKAPNEIGLYDMSGNVYEWTDSRVFEAKDPTEIAAKSLFHKSAINTKETNNYYACGGCFNSKKDALKFKYIERLGASQFIGFRLVLEMKNCSIPGSSSSF